MTDTQLSRKYVFCREYHT